MPARGDQSRIAVEQAGERRAVARLDGLERAPERLAVLGQIFDVVSEGVPAREPVLAREYEARVRDADRADVGVARIRERRVVGPHDGDAVLETARDHAPQPVGAILVVADVVDERVREPGAVLPDALDVGLETGPAREAVVTGDLALRLAELERLRAGLARADELLGLLAQLLQARGGG